MSKKSKKKEQMPEDIKALYFFPLLFGSGVFIFSMFAIIFTSSINVYLPFYLILIFTWGGIYYFYRRQYKNGLFSSSNSLRIIKAKYISQTMTIIFAVLSIYITFFDHPLKKDSELNIGTDPI